MSFPKAKIHRFNEVNSCAPPPGQYDPKYETKAKLAVIDKSKRFEDQKLEPSPSLESLDSASSSCSRARHREAVVFRTPQLPRKKLTTTPRSAIEMRTTPKPRPSSDETARKSLNFRSGPVGEDLVHQINELTRVHNFQLREKDEELNSLHEEVSDLRRSISKMDNTHATECNELRRSYEADIEKIKTELEEVVSTAQKQKEENERLIQDLETKVKMLEENVRNCNAINNDLEYQLAENNINFIELKNQYADLEEELKESKSVMEKMVEEKEAELKKMKTRFSEELEGFATAAELNVENLSEKFEKRLEALQRDFDIERMEQDVEFTSRLEQIADEVKEKSRQLDSQAKALFETVTTMADDFDQKIRDVVDSLTANSVANEEKLEELARVSEELEVKKAGNLEQSIVIVDLQDKLDELERELEKSRKHCRKYEIVQGEATRTIQVLSQRLFESETDVEQLNADQEEMNLRKNALEEKVKALLQENNQLRTGMTDLEKTLVEQVRAVENALLARVDTFRKVAADEAENFRFTLEEKQKTIEMMLGEIDFYKNKGRKTADSVAEWQTRATLYKDQLRETTGKIRELECDYADKINAQKVLYNDLVREFDLLKLSSSNTEEELRRENERLKEENDEISKINEAQLVEIKKWKQEMDEAKERFEQAKQDMRALEESSFEHVRHIEELALKLDHYTDCGVKSAQKVTVLSKENEVLSNEIKKLSASLTEKDEKIEAVTGENEENKKYVQSMTEHVVSLMDELAAKDRTIDGLTTELEMKTLTMIQVSEEYEKMKAMLEGERLRVEAIQQDTLQLAAEHEQYVDELISDLVLEKERCSELTQNLEESKTNNKTFMEKLEMLDEHLNAMARKEQNNAAVIGELENEKIELENSVLELSEVKEALEKRLADAEKNGESEQKNFTKKLKEAEAEKNDLTEIIKRQWDEIDLLNSEVSSLQEEMEEIRRSDADKVEELKAVCQAELQNEIFALQQNLEDTQKVLIDLKTREEDVVFKLKTAEFQMAKDEEAWKVKEADLRNSIHELEGRLEGMEKRKNEYKMYAMQLEAEMQLLKETNTTLTDEKEKLKEQLHEDSMKVASLTAQVSDLECRNGELENIIGPFKDQLVQFEAERALLLSKTENTEKELKALALEHAKSLGHQNHKQKIKHLVQLNETIADLKKEMEKLRNENNKLRATLLENPPVRDGSLRRVGSTRVKTHGGNKENGSGNNHGSVPAQTPTSSDIKAASPKTVRSSSERQSSPANPLKQRNVL